ncbi:vacuolar h+-atpase assembly protein [Moniliophthora roreri]|nr:vacuolar h+-atpase assembly protein [Moniliophthora roreri]
MLKLLSILVQTMRKELILFVDRTTVCLALKVNDLVGPLRRNLPTRTSFLIELMPGKWDQLEGRDYEPSEGQWVAELVEGSERCQQDHFLAFRG